MTFSSRTDEAVRRLETLIDELSWGFELYEAFTLKQGITFKLSIAHGLRTQHLTCCIPLRCVLVQQVQTRREVWRDWDLKNYIKGVEDVLSFVRS